MTELTVPPRSDIPHQYTWNAASVYPSIEACEKEFQHLESALTRLASRQNSLSSGAAALLETLRLVEDIRLRVMKLNMYANMAYSVDTGDQSAAVMNDRVQNLVGTVMGATAFLEPGLVAVGRETLDRWTHEEPDLAVYAHYFDNLFRQQPHLRSAEIEGLMGNLAGPFSGPRNTYSALTDADFQFPPAAGADGQSLPLTHSSLESILNGSDRIARRTAWENYRDTYLSYRNSLANIFSASIKQDVFDARIRRHPSTLDASLFDSHIPVQVFDNLVETFKKNLPTWHRYWRLRRKALGVNVLHPYDIWAPLTSFKPTIDYRQAVDFIGAALAPLGEDYVKVLRRGCLQDRWVDIYPNQGKIAGAFSSGIQTTYPFICLSYTGDLESVSTLVHELGHSMHSYLTWQQQPFVYSDYSLFVAETASNFHQAMLRAHLLKTMTEPSFQIAILQEAMSNFHRYLFIMPTLARFELEAHRRVERGEGLNADELNKVMADLFAEGYGGEVYVDPGQTGITWATFGHLYADYYVYQYATGISAANALARRVLSGTADAARDYRNFLSAGSSVYPLEALKIAGVDLTTPQVVEDAFAVLSGYIDRLAKLLGE